jgi:hypothetical protein
MLTVHRKSPLSASKYVNRASISPTSNTLLSSSVKTRTASGSSPSKSPSSRLINTFTTLGTPLKVKSIYYNYLITNKVNDDVSSYVKLCTQYGSEPVLEFVVVLTDPTIPKCSFTNRKKPMVYHLK